MFAKEEEAHQLSPGTGRRLLLNDQDDDGGGGGLVKTNTKKKRKQVKVSSSESFDMSESDLQLLCPARRASSLAAAAGTLFEASSGRLFIINGG